MTMACDGKIYVITNKLTGKKYVGKTTLPVLIRWAQHCRAKTTTPFSRAIAKYGKDCFTVRIAAKATTREKLNKLEKHWIKKLNCRVPAGYNLMHGGDGGPHAPETIKKLRKLCQDPVYKKRQKDGLTKFWSVKENKDRILKNLTEIKKQNYENGKRHKSHKPAFDVSLTREWRVARGEKQKKLWATAAYRKKLKKIFADKEWRAARNTKLKATLSLRMQDPEWVAKKSAAIKAGLQKLRADPVRRAAKFAAWRQSMDRRKLARKGESK